MRDDSLLVVVACAALIACAPAPVQRTYPSFCLRLRRIAQPPPGAPIEPGRPVRLNARQQQAVVVGVVKWMKDPASISFAG